MSKLTAGRHARLKCCLSAARQHCPNYVETPHCCVVLHVRVCNALYSLPRVQVAAGQSQLCPGSTVFHAISRAPDIPQLVRAAQHAALCLLADQHWLPSNPAVL
jgi:hypothetical protein